MIPLPDAILIALFQKFNGSDRPSALTRFPCKSMGKTYLVVLTTLVFSQCAAFASAISLTEAQRLELVTLVVSDAEAKKQFQTLRREADASIRAHGQPIARIDTAGRLEADPLKAKSLVSLVDMKKLNALGFSYAVTSNDDFSAAARRIIIHWAKVNRPDGIPIDDTKLEPLFVAYDLTRSTFSAGERVTVEDWLRKIARLELQSALTNSVTARNNWNSHRLKVVGLIGFLLDDADLIADAVEGFKAQVEANIYSDGSSFDFHQRDALHYHCYDLEPLLVLAVTARENGIDLYHYRSPSGASLAKSVEFLVPYCDGTRTHAEWVHTKIKFDRARGEAGEKGFSPGSAFHPREARGVLELASFFDESYTPLAVRLYDNGAAHYPSWQAVLNRVRK